MRLEKQEILKLSELFEIFRINLLNLFSAQTQKISRRALRVPPKNIEELIIRFLKPDVSVRVERKYSTSR